MVDVKDYIQWLEKAGHDLRAAQLLLQGQEVCDIVAFHAQQCAEKALKAFLLYKEGILVETHSLPRLNQKCAAWDSDFKRFAHTIHILNSFYIETRYPAADALIVSEDNARQAAGMAEDIFNTVRDKIHSAGA